LIPEWAYDRLHADGSNVKSDPNVVLHDRDTIVDSSR